MPFHILAVRSPNSIFGPSEGLVKDNSGFVMEFESREAAQRRIDAYTKGLCSPNVSYSVLES